MSDADIYTNCGPDDSISPGEVYRVAFQENIVEHATQDLLELATLPFRGAWGDPGSGMGYGDRFTVIYQNIATQTQGVLIPVSEPPVEGSTAWVVDLQVGQQAGSQTVGQLVNILQQLSTLVGVQSVELLAAAGTTTRALDAGQASGSKSRAAAQTNAQAKVPSTDPFQSIINTVKSLGVWALVGTGLIAVIVVVAWLPKPKSSSGGTT